MRRSVVPGRFAIRLVAIGNWEGYSTEAPTTKARHAKVERRPRRAGWHGGGRWNGSIKPKESTSAAFGDCRGLLLAAILVDDD